jgi:hypothetical protein
MIFNNIELRKVAVKIVSEGLIFTKGTISGFSIEVEDPDKNSSTSYLYYQDEKSRDSDFNLLKLISENIN